MQLAHLYTYACVYSVWWYNLRPRTVLSLERWSATSISIREVADAYLPKLRNCCNPAFSGSGTKGPLFLSSIPLIYYTCARIYWSVTILESPRGYFLYILSLIICSSSTCTVLNKCSLDSAYASYDVVAHCSRRRQSSFDNIWEMGKRPRKTIKGWRAKTFTDTFFSSKHRSIIFITKV